MELERHTQLMYTSCGWFFDEISGIETVQIIAYAGRVLQLAAKLFGEPGRALEAEFLAKLAELAKSNVAVNRRPAPMSIANSCCPRASRWSTSARTTPSAPSFAAIRTTASSSASTCSARATTCSPPAAVALR